MAKLTLDEYLAWPWVAVMERLPEGDYRLTVAGLADFELFADTTEELLDWRDALKSHLAGYIKVNKVIPLPRFDPPEAGQTSTGSPARTVFLTETLQVRPAVIA